MSKALLEKRADLQEQMETIIETAKSETRAMTTEEIEKFDGMEEEIRNIDATLEREEKETMAEERTMVDKELTVEQREYKEFADFIRESRAAQNMTFGANGAVIPKTIVNKIMAKVEEISPLYARATKYSSKGTLIIPKVDDSTDDITVAYGTEFSALTGHANDFASITLTGYLYGALTLVSKSLINNSDFNLVEFVIDRMAEKVAKFIEGELLNGTNNKVSGIAGSYDSTNMKVTLANKAAITADELIEIQDSVPDMYQANACWIMNKATRQKIRKLKNSNNEYLLVPDFSKEGAYTLLGKPVFLSDNVTALGTVSKNVIFYGDMSGLAVKEVENAEAQILRENYAAQHAIGIVVWGEVDAKVENVQKIAVAVTPAS